MDYPKEFFRSCLSEISEAYNPVSLSNTMGIVNHIFQCFTYEGVSESLDDSRTHEAEFLNNPLKKDLCIISPRPTTDPGEVGSAQPSPDNPLANFNHNFTLHIK